MNIIFSDNFNTGLTGWESNPVGTSFGQFGCNYTLCLSCGNNFSSGPRKYFPTQTQNTFRFFYAYFSIGSASTGYILSLYDDGGGHSLIHLLVNPDGSMRFVSATILDSPAGLIPTNGTWTAIQITSNMYTLPRPGSPGLINNVGDFQIIVNNVVVWNLPGIVISANNYGPSAVSLGWQACELLGYRMVGGGSTAIVAIDNFEVEDSVLVKTYNLCSPIHPALYENICSNPPVPPPVITDKSGIYMITESNKTHDIYNTEELKIPNPTFKTGILGE